MTAKPLIGKGFDQVPVNGMLGKLAFLDNVEPNTQVVNRSSDSVFVPGDVGKFIKYTGTVTQTFSSVAALKTDWFVYVKNAGTGFITLDPYGSETINVDGNDVAAWELWPQESGMLICNGAGFDFIRFTNGSIIKAISPVSTVSFAIGGAGLVSRKTLLLDLSNVVVGTGASTVELKINSTSADRATGVVVESATVYGHDTTPINFGVRGLMASATTSSRLSGKAYLDVDPVSGVYAKLDCHYASYAGNFCSDSLSGIYSALSANAITSISLVPSAGNFSAGTFVLTEV